MPDPYDWERSENRWGRRGDATPVTHFEFLEVIRPIERKLDLLYDHVRSVEERLPEERAKQFASDVASSLWARFLVIVLAVLTAFLLTNVVHLPWLPW